MSSTRRLTRSAALAVAVAVALGGCGAIPRSGPVHRHAEPTRTAAQPTYEAEPAGPRDGATPEQIVRGFLAAGTGVADDYSVAREYLTPELAGTWHPDTRTIVHRGDATPVPRLEDNEYRVNLEVESIVDGSGVIERKPAGATEVLDFEVVQVDGQWRISEAPDATALTRPDFEDIFEPHHLYFADEDLSNVVVDPRWFPDRVPVSTSIVRALLGGPAPYLRGAVTSAFPPGTTLARSAVPVREGTATVELSVPDFDPANIEINRRMHDQLSLSLRSLTAVNDVELLVDGAPVELGAGWTDTAPVQDVTVPSRQVGLRDGELVFYQGGQTEAVDGLPPLDEHPPSRPAMDAAAEHFAFVDRGTGSLVTVARGEEPVERFSGTGLSRPSFDEHGWVWAGDSAGTVRAVRTGTEAEEALRVEAPWLTGRTVTSLRISRGGTRALVVTEDDGVSQIWLAGVVREPDGTPRRLNEPYRVAADVEADVALWLSDREFVAAPLGGTGSVRPRIYDVSGRFRELPGIVGLTGLSGGNGTSSVFAVAGGTLHMLTGNAWAPQSRGVLDTAFAG
ncbi:LpqB family beta-propeller domain-containing protein [Kocuria sp. CPCC 205268]|uniref:LpqB family beta-propeller domain-containing protein n=1 Tax=Kocuria oxytropis TaxID=3058913 RepID=UPI0034D6E78D